MSATLSEAYRRLFEAFGPQHWWPGQSPFEVMVGAVLTQNTSWRNVERAIGNLREADLLEPRALYDVPVEELEELIRPAGYFRVKARRLRNLVAFIVEQYEGSLDAVFRSDVADLRRQLLARPRHWSRDGRFDLALRGRPGELRRRRLHAPRLARHGWIDFDAAYDEIQEYVESGLPRDVQQYNEFHALLVRVGKDYCHKTGPKCAECPLREMLPNGGPLSADE